MNDEMAQCLKEETANAYAKEARSDSVNYSTGSVFYVEEVLADLVDSVKL